MSEQLRENTFVEADGTIYRVNKQLEWDDCIDLQIQNAETGETHNVRVDKLTT